MKKNRIFSLFLLLQLIPLGIKAQSPNEELIVAARKSNVEAVKALLAKGADVNAKTEYGATPLFFACDRGNLEVVKILIDAGADVNISDTFYKSTAVNWAVSKDHGAIVKLLLEKGARAKEPVMFAAVTQGKKTVVKSVLELGGFSAEAMSNYLAAAEKNNQPEIAELLKSAGAKPKPKPDYKVEPEKLKSYEGVFKNERLEITVKVKEGKLIATADGGFESLLIPLKEHNFEVEKATGVTIVFNVEGDKIIGLNWKNIGGELVLKRVESK